MSALNQDFDLIQGSSTTVKWTILDSLGNPYDLGANSFRFRAMYSPIDKVPLAVLDLTDFDVEGDDNEILVLLIESNLTSSLEVLARSGVDTLHYDVRDTSNNVVLASGKIFFRASPSR